MSVERLSSDIKLFNVSLLVDKSCTMTMVVLMVYRSTLPWEVVDSTVSQAALGNGKIICPTHTSANTAHKYAFPRIQAAASLLNYKEDKRC